jgi:sporulation protein YlmC with PRC-barrel domain
MNALRSTIRSRIRNGRLTAKVEKRMILQHKPSNSALQAMSNTDLLPDDPHQDIRGHIVIDRHGEKMGHVSDLFIDDAERKVRMLEISTGGLLGFGERHALVPVDAVTMVGAKDIHIDQTREHVSKSPAYDPALVRLPTREYWEPFYGYYGLSPYWGTGYVYPQFPSFANRAASDDESLRKRGD